MSHAEPDLSEERFAAQGSSEIFNYLTVNEKKKIQKQIEIKRVL